MILLPFFSLYFDFAFFPSACHYFLCLLFLVIPPLALASSLHLTFEATVICMYLFFTSISLCCFCLVLFHMSLNSSNDAFPCFTSLLSLGSGVMSQEENQEKCLGCSHLHPCLIVQVDLMTAIIIMLTYIILLL